MSAVTFANHTKTAPNPDSTSHPAFPSIRYTCHAAALHWAFMELGDNQATANARVEAINKATCIGCSTGGNQHSGISHTWYGNHMIAPTAPVQIPNKAALMGAVAIGDVLITNAPQYPTHSMVVVGKQNLFVAKFVYVRGFNNTGTLGTGPHLQYDNADRDIHKDSLWHNLAGQIKFGTSHSTGSALYCVSYANYIAQATTIRNACSNVTGQWAYNGPK